MRNYWLRIAASAFGIFAVGMILISTVRSVKTKVTRTINSTDPIPIPLAGMIPFRLDSARLGSLSRLEFLRTDPQHVSGVRVIVKLADSVSPETLRRCVIALDDLDNIGDQTTFRCQVTDQAGLERFGTVVIRGTSDSFPLLLPAKAVADLRSTEIRVDRNGVQVSSARDQRRQAMRERTEAMRDELSTRIDARSDSIDALRDQADELEDRASAAGPAERRALQLRADSARTAMRAVVDRMKADEARLQAVEELAGFSQQELDSLGNLGRQIGDSVRSAVARQLQEMQVELRRMQVERGQGAPAAATVGTPAAPGAPEPPRPPKP